jgi:hypothetical protein
VQHFQLAQIGQRNHGQVDEFFQKHFLHWLEALSLMGKTSDGVLMVTALETTLTVSDSVNVMLSSLH